MIYKCCGGDGQHKVLCSGSPRSPALDAKRAFQRHCEVCSCWINDRLCAKGRRLANVETEERLLNGEPSYVGRRDEYGIWCLGEGWCPAFAPPERYRSKVEAEAALARWAKENPSSRYSVRVMVIGDGVEARFRPSALSPSLFYVLRRGGEIEPCPDPGVWSVWCEDHGSIRTIALTRLGVSTIVTSFTGIDVSLGKTEHPLVFETAIFGGQESGRRIFASSAGSAMLNHVDAEQLVRSADHEGSS